MAGRKLFVVCADDEREVGRGGGAGDEHPPRAPPEARLGEGPFSAEPGAFHHHVDIGQVERAEVARTRQPDAAPVHDERIRLQPHLAFPGAKGGIVFEEIGGQFGPRDVVHCDDLQPVAGRPRKGGAQHRAADAAEAVERDADRHGQPLLVPRRS